MVDRDAVRRSYDELAATYAAERADDDRGTELLARFLDTLPDGASVLDAGCGQGDPVLVRLAATVTATGVDVSRGQLRLAADAAPDAALVQGEMTALPFDAGAFDAVVAYWSLIHVPEGDHQTVVDEFARVLRPGGKVLLCEGTTAWAGENPDWLDSGVSMSWHIAGAAATRDHLRNAGFVVVDSWTAPSSLEADGDEAGDDDDPWTFLAARLAADSA